LDCSQLGKGALWVNGRNLGRFWKIGPQFSLYLPGAWLRAGDNDVVALDLFGHEQSPALRGVKIRTTS
jgi:beta-galactosidase